MMDKCLSVGIFLNFSFLLVFLGATFIFVNMVKIEAQDQALLEAEAKAKIILDRNLATHTYFANFLKPKVFELLDQEQEADYFEPAWMSSTYAIRQIDSIFKSIINEDYYYKESAINARSPENEADEFERAFIEEIKKNPELKYRSLIRKLDGQYYFVTLRRGEVMEATCLKCHDTPDRAPQDLVKQYGPKRSFNRKSNEVVSAISIRVPLSDTYTQAEQFSSKLFKLFFIVIVAVFIFQYLLYRLIVYRPLAAVHKKALLISHDNKRIGEVMPLPLGYEFRELTSSFNLMSQKLRSEFDQLEERNEELQNALKEIKQLRGILPICSYCKKIRDDRGAWEAIENYIYNHSEAQFSHGVCPECYKEIKDKLNTGFVDL